MLGTSGISSRLQAIRNRIRRACERSGRSPDSVILVGASKTVPVELLREAISLGLNDLGENRVQEAVPKIEAIGRSVRWHMIGHLQRNKAGKAVEWFDRIQSVDDLPLGEALSARAVQVGRVMPAMIEVNVSGEASKYGVPPGRLEALLESLSGLPGLAVDGLMTIGHPVGRPEEARADFARLRELRDRCERSLGLRLPELSMGMSFDYEVAIQEGATLVRVGSALFGARPTP